MSPSGLLNMTSLLSSKEPLVFPIAPLLNGCFITVKSSTSLLATTHLVLLVGGMSPPSWSPKRQPKSTGNCFAFSWQ